MNSCFQLRLGVHSPNIWQISSISLLFNFFLAADTTSNYLVNRFPNVVIDGHRSSDISLSEHTVHVSISKQGLWHYDGQFFYICKTFRKKNKSSWKHESYTSKNISWVEDQKFLHMKMLFWLYIKWNQTKMFLYLVLRIHFFC